MAWLGWISLQKLSRVADEVELEVPPSLLLWRLTVTTVWVQEAGHFCSSSPIICLRLPIQIHRGCSPETSQPPPLSLLLTLRTQGRYMPCQHHRNNSRGPTHPRSMRQTTLEQHRHPGKQSNLSRLNCLGLGLPREFLGPENICTPWAWAAFFIPSWLMVLIDWNCQARLPRRIFYNPGSIYALTNTELSVRKESAKQNCRKGNKLAERTVKWWMTRHWGVVPHVNTCAWCKWVLRALLGTSLYRSLK